MENARRVEGDPDRDDDRLADQKGGGAEKPCKTLCLEGEPIAAKHRREVAMFLVEAEMVGLGSRRRGRLGGIHGCK